LPPSPHVKEPSVTAHYEHYAHDDEHYAHDDEHYAHDDEHYAHDEWSIRDLLHWQNYPEEADIKI
jgi:hypothetical protein